MSIPVLTTTLRAQRSLLIGGALLVGIFFAGSCWDSHRAAIADGEIRVLEQETAAAQRERHAAAFAAIIARTALREAKRQADSLEAAAAAAEQKSAKLGQLVRVLSETSLVVQVTPSDPATVVSVPRIVTAYIGSLTATIAEKDRALAARDTQLVRADTVIVTVDRQVAADSTVITTQASTVVAEKAARPRFGFKAGVIAGATVVLVIVKAAAVLLK